MSYVNKTTLKAQKRRPSITRLTPEEAINSINQIVDEANDKIALARAYASHWESVAAELVAENETLRRRVAELEERVRQLEKRVKPKAGKKREEWELEQE